jgi:hypothetical protein
MTPNEHLNAFCVLFAQLKDVVNAGPQRRDCQEAIDVRKKMYGHYPHLNDAMVKYLDQFTGALISLGFNFDEMKTANKVDVSDLDQVQEVKVSGKFEFAKLVDVSEKGKIYNYNEHSKPITQLPPEEFAALKKKTIENILREQQMMATGQRPKAPQPKTWSLPDGARDW